MKGTTMAKWRALAPLYINNRYIEISELFSDDGAAGYSPISSSVTPSPAWDPQDTDAIAKLTATFTGQLPTPQSPTQPTLSSGVLQLWGLRTQFQPSPLPAPSAAWKSIIHN
jgi:hypothetical protein